MKRNILIVGSGGRECAFAWKFSQSPRLGRLYVSPGNGGTQKFAKNLSIKAMDIDGLIKFAKNNDIDFTVVGSEELLKAGVVDSFQEQGLQIFGPTKAAAQIETSKAFASRFMKELKIPQPSFRVFQKYDRALEYIQKHGAPIIVEASGLALGKGVYPCKTLKEAEEALKKIMIERIHGDAGNEVIIEEFIYGQEISIHAFCDGKTSVLMPTSQDHKPIFDGDKGLNTGGMGAFGPVPWVTDKLIEKIRKKIVEPTLKGLAQKGYPFTGCLYPGLMITKEGPMVLEENVRFGDPEAQVCMRLLKTDFIDIIEACIEGRLDEIEIKWEPRFAICVVIASGGYPEKYEKGFPIQGIREAEHVPGVIVFQAGTMKDNGQLKTSGGRVLNVTAVGETLRVAHDRAYEAVLRIRFKNAHYRTDIGAKVLA